MAGRACRARDTIYLKWVMDFCSYTSRVISCFRHIPSRIFLQTVITNDFQNCGYHPDSLQAWLVPDIIGTSALEGNDPTFGKAVWCTDEVPKDIKLEHTNNYLSSKGTEKTSQQYSSPLGLSTVGFLSLQTFISTSGSNPMP